MNDYRSAFAQVSRLDIEALAQWLRTHPFSLNPRFFVFKSMFISSVFRWFDPICMQARSIQFLN
jgi:hypothetical protein